MLTLLYIVFYLHSTKDDTNINVRLTHTDKVPQKSKLSQAMTIFITTYNKNTF